MTDPLRVVVADDSPFVCRLLKTYLEAAPGIEVVGAAADGQAAVELVRRLRPDAVTLDLDMPGMDGLRALERIMAECPTAVILISGVTREAAALTLRAIELGAADFILKYTPGVDSDAGLLRQEIVAKVHSAARLRASRPTCPGERPQPPKSRAGMRSPERVVVIGASTGGPIAIRELLSALGPVFDDAIVIVQHLPATFTGVLAGQLRKQIGLPVREAEEGDRLECGQALIAPGDRHLQFGLDGRVGLRPAGGDGLCPSVDATMCSAAEAFGDRAVGVILSGMGDDGKKGMAAICSAGGMTYAQAAATCVVNGMPRRAIEAGVVQGVGSPAEIGSLLREEPQPLPEGTCEGFL